MVNLESTAYHEAGHAVAAIVQGLSIDSVTIEPSGDFLGKCLHPSALGYEFRNQRERRGIARACIVSSYAGLEAERLINPDADRWRSKGDSDLAFEVSRDYEVLPRYCDYVGDENHWRYLTKLRKEAGKLMRQNERAVSETAKALLRFKTLSHDQVEEIVNKQSAA